MPVLSRPGVPLPLHATGVGKVLLAYAPRRRRRAVPRDAQAGDPLHDHRARPDAARARGVRRLGYARTVEEMGYGTCSLAVPVLDGGGAVVASLGLVTRTVRKDLVRFVPALQVAAASITRRMLV